VISRYVKAVLDLAENASCRNKVQRFRFILLVLLAATPAIADEQTVTFASTGLHAAYCFQILKYLISTTISERDGQEPVPPLPQDANEQVKHANEEWANAQAALKRQLDSEIIAMSASAEQLRLFMLGRTSPNSDDGFFSGTLMARADIALLSVPIPASCYLNGETPSSGIPASDIDRLMKCSTEATRPYLEPVDRKIKTCLDLSWLF
jgi:hypothetical protein